MRKFGKKLAGILAAVVLVAALPVAAGAANIQYGAPSVTVNTTTIAFAGHEWVVIGDSGSGVLSGNTDHVTLLHSNGCTCSGFGDTVFGSDHVYEKSALHTAMTNIYNGFGAVEQRLVIDRTLDGVNGIGNAGGPGTDSTATSQNVWPLSESEYRTIYDATQVVGISELLQYGNLWWLRSPDYFDPNYAWAGWSDGSYRNYGHVFYPLAVRPAFILNLSSVLFTSAAAGGKPGTAGQWSAADPLQQTDMLKFTMEDAELSLTGVFATEVSGNRILFSYTAGAAGSSTYNALSAIITTDTGALKYYGRLNDAPAQNANGGAYVTVPGGLAATDKLYVFIEQANLDTANMTDFASTRVQLDFATQTAPTGLAGVDCTTAANDNGQITGTTADMEYSSDNGNTWTDCTASPTTVAPGTYQVRYKGKVASVTAYLASPAATNIVVGAYTAVPGAPTSLTVTPGDSQLAFSWVAPTDTGSSPITGYEYSVSAGADDWQTVPGGAAASSHTVANLTNDTAYTVKVRAVNSAGKGIAASTIGTPTAAPPAPTLAVAGQNSITPPSGTVTAGKDFTFSAAGHRQDVAGVVVGDTRYIPVSWSINPSGTWTNPPYTATARVDSAGAHTLTVTYRLERWNGSQWEDTGEIDTKTATITAQAASSSSGPASSSGSGSAGASSAAAGGSPQTGDSSAMGLWVAVLVLSLVALATGCLVLYRRRKKS